MIDATGHGKPLHNPEPPVAEASDHGTAEVVGQPARFSGTAHVNALEGA
jgi:hypothetical protein